MPSSVRLPTQLAVWACAALLGSHTAATQAETAVLAPMPTVIVQAATSARGLALDGTIQPVRQATVAAQVAGNVTLLAVKAGDRVRAGQLLARIDERATTAGLAQSEAGVVQADAAMRQARTELNRSRELRAQGYVSQAALDIAQTQFQAAEAAWQQAQAGRSQAALARGFAAVTAPFDGLVLVTHVDAGDLAAPGRPVATVYAPGALRAVVQLPASQATLARAAQRVEVQRPDGRWVVPVRRTELPTADAVSQTVEWRLDLAGADGDGLLPGQTVAVRFSGAAAPASSVQTLTLPATAVLQRAELSAVYVAQGNQFVLRAVRTGARLGDQIEALAGLQAGERVAVQAVRAGLAGARPAAAPTAAVTTK
ncbi:MAG: efflux RND transporter periplasmic adaptor subunit [Burkholderiales bacterium]